MKLKPLHYITLPPNTSFLVTVNKRGKMAFLEAMTMKFDPAPAKCSLQPLGSVPCSGRPGLMQWIFICIGKEPQKLLRFNKAGAVFL